MWANMTHFALTPGKRISLSPGCCYFGYCQAVRLNVTYISWISKSNPNRLDLGPDAHCGEFKIKSCVTECLGYCAAADGATTIPSEYESHRYFSSDTMPVSAKSDLYLSSDVTFLGSSFQLATHRSRWGMPGFANENVPKGDCRPMVAFLVRRQAGQLRFSSRLQ